MKFNEFDQTQWNELQPYLDTALLPLSGLTGKEAPWQAKEALLSVGEVLEWIEIPFKGRTVTYPALHFQSDSNTYRDHLSQVCKGLKQVGFRFVVIVTARPLAFACPEGADLIVAKEDEAVANIENSLEQKAVGKARAAKCIQQLWESHQPIT